MRVAMYYNNNDIRLEELPKPEIGPGEMLIRIVASGICGSDVMEWYRLHKAPLVLGHEIAGDVAEVGDGVSGFAVGDRVVATHHVPCMDCHYCNSGHETVCDTLLSGTNFYPGGFSEYVRLPALNVSRGTWKTADSLSCEDATFVEPLACVLRGQRMAGLKAGDSVLVLGSGIAGLLHVHLAAISGAGLIAATDLSDFRLNMAKQFGANAAFSAREDIAAKFRQLNGGLGADVVIVCAGAPTAFIQAMDAVERGGVILLFAPTLGDVTVPLAINKLFWRRDVTITTTYAGSPADCVTAMKLLANKRVRVNEMITHRFGLADTVKGSRLVAEAGDSMKIIIKPQE